MQALVWLATSSNGLNALPIIPDVRHVVPEFGQTFLREIIYPPFRIVYRRDPNTVRIVRIWRSERQLRLTEHEDKPT